jgi:hypothetical protein
MSATTRASRRSRVAAEQQAAKERRQKVVIAVLGAVLVIVLAVELPGLLGSSGGGSSSAPPVSTPAISAPLPASSGAKDTSKQLRALLRQAPHDVFAARSGGGSATTLGSVPVPPGLHDPFASPHSPEASVAPAAPKPVTSSPLPSTIVIGAPGKGRVAVKGWIVILASIPTAEGESSARAFAGAAQKRAVGKVSVLNSSNRRPLRGGFWVVYTGPYNTLTLVTRAAGGVHRAGFGTAYIRELIVYKKK